MPLLDGQIAIITGAGQGLGRAIALEFAAEGATPVLIDVNADALVRVREEVRAAGADCLVYPLDIADHTALATAVADVVARFGQVHVLVNNAGIYRSGTILSDTLDDWRRVLAVNLEAAYMGSKLVAPHMVRQRYGRIIHIASIAGFASRGNVGSYNASKGALIAYTKSMAVELGPHNILVNAVAPGFMRTPMMVSNDVDESDTSDFKHWYIEHGKIPLRRVGTPEDVSGTVTFLASSYCRYMTGQVLVVDGGLTSTF